MVAFIAQVIISFDPLRAWLNKDPHKSAYFLLILNIAAIVLSFVVLASGGWPVINWITVVGLVGLILSLVWLGANITNLYAIGALDKVVQRFRVFADKVADEVDFRRIQSNTVRQQIRGDGKDDRALEHLIG